MKYGIAGSRFGELAIGFSSGGICAILPRFSSHSPWNTVSNSKYSSNIVRVLRLEEGGKAEHYAAKKIVDTFINNSAHGYKTCATEFLIGTPFQKRVWEALIKIPFGETRTYLEIAEQLGAGRAVRAVGSACGANPIPIIVPCHRVTSKNPKKINYRWGQEMKNTLLEMEKINEGKDK